MNRLFFFIALLIPFISTSQAFAFQSLNPYMVEAEIRKVNNFVSVDGDTVKVNVMGKGYAPNQPYFNKTVSIPKSRFLSWLKANLKNLMKINPWWIAFAAAMAAAGWAFDELLNQYVKPVNNFTRGLCHPSMVKMTASECINISKAGLGNPPSFAVSGNWFRNTSDFPNNTVYSINFSWDKDAWGNKGWGKVNMISTPDSFETTTQPVADQTLLDSVFANFMADPVSASQAMTSPSGYPYDDLFKDVDLKYIPGVSEADYPALDCYFRGALQTSNASAACYATESEYQRIKQIAEQIKAGSTPDGIVGGLNDALKDPLTQAQLEETLKKEKEAESEADQEAATKAQEALEPAEGALDQLAEDKTWLEQQITDAPLQAPPSQGINLPKWVWPVGNCKPFPVTFEVSNLSATANDGGAFCRNYNEVYHPLIYWFIYMLLSLYLFNLWNKTMLQVVGGR